MQRARILVVDDRPNMLKLLERLLSAQHEVTKCTGGKQALALIDRTEFDLVITDVRMPEVGGMEIMRRVRERHPLTQVIMMTAYGEISQAVEAMKSGAIDYITKPFENEVISVVVEKALEHRKLLEQAHVLREEVADRYGLGSIIGKSPAMEKAFTLLRKAASSDSTVLILGESGTGKELFARAIHYNSRRAERRFVPVNCGAIPHDLLDSELFGHAKGAFTGADSARDGLFREADGGTLFLDEISDLDLDLQVKLNRAIQEGEIRPVGEPRVQKVDVRIVAATNRDLRQMVQARQFREDLFFRLSVFPIQAPPLRERIEDVPLLLAHFLERLNERQQHGIEGMEPEALKVLLHYDWPGNVRQLENVIERAVLLEPGTRISRRTVAGCLEEGPSHTTEDPLLDLPYKEAIELATSHASREYVAGLLRRTGGNVTRAAKEAGIERESFHRLVRKCGLRAQDFRED